MKSSMRCFLKDIVRWMLLPPEQWNIHRQNLSYTKNNYVLMKLNQFPVIATHAHTRPFRRKWLNALTGLFLPTGIFFYFRMIRFRVRLYRDLRTILRVNEKLIPRVILLGDVEKEGRITIDAD